MISLRLFSILLLAIASTVAASAPAWAVSSEIQDFRPKNCGSQANSRCLNVNATKAEGSNFKRLYVLNDIEVSLTDKNLKSLRTWRAKSGYYDLDENRVVLFEEPKQPEKVFEFSEIDAMKWKL